jgi:branched-chain amino acid transport system ATP-binding protein
MLQVRNLNAYYGEFQALEDVSLELPDHGITALLGANAAGKTTSLRVISGVLPLRSGSVLHDGEDLSRQSPAARVARGIVHVPEGRMLFGTLTVEENLLVGGYQKRKSKHYRKNLDRVYDMLPQLAERRAQMAGSLSGGEQQMCAIGRGLMARPRLLMLDEPSLGLAPVVVRTIFEDLRRINQGGLTILLVEQNVLRSLQLCQRGYVLENGRITLAGGRETLLASPHIKQAYLGL